MSKKKRRRWPRTGEDVATHPPDGLFRKDAFNRTGRNLAPARRRAIEKAKRILQERHRRKFLPRQESGRTQEVG